MKKLFSITEKNKQKSIYLKIDETDEIFNIEIDPTSLILMETEKTKRSRLEKEKKESGGNLEIAVKNIKEKNLN